VRAPTSVEVASENVLVACGDRRDTSCRQPGRSSSTKIPTDVDYLFSNPYRLSSGRSKPPKPHDASGRSVFSAAGVEREWYANWHPQSAQVYMVNRSAHYHRLRGGRSTHPRCFVTAGGRLQRLPGQREHVLEFPGIPRRRQVRRRVARHDETRRVYSRPRGRPGMRRSPGRRQVAVCALTSLLAAARQNDAATDRIMRTSDSFSSGTSEGRTSPSR